MTRTWTRSYFWPLAVVVLLMTAVLSWLLRREPGLLGLTPGSDAHRYWQWGVPGIACLVLMVMGIYYAVVRRAGRQAYEVQRHALKGDDHKEIPDAVPVSEASTAFDGVRRHLRQRQGFFWRRKTRILLVVGEPEQVEALVPGLTTQHWLEGRRTLLVWGGRPQDELAEPLHRTLRTLRRRRPLDGIVWALTEAQSQKSTALDNAWRQFQQQGQRWHWQAPLYLWQVVDSDWPQRERPTQSVGCLLPARCTPERMAGHLRTLVAPLRREGMTQMQENIAHDYLLRLSQTLAQRGIEHWSRTLTPLLRDFSPALALRGLMFSLPVVKVEDGAPHGWLPDPVWQGVLEDSRARGRRVGFSWEQSAYAGLLGLVLLWGAGSLLSFLTNRQQVVTAQAQLAAIQQQASPDEQLLALRQMQTELERLQFRAEHGTPWYQRFGLSQNAALLNALWPHFTQANNRLIRDGAAARLHQQLSKLAALPPETPERIALGPKGYDQLKAYLMMARPEKVDTAFLLRVLAENDTARTGVSPGVWQAVAPDLWGFYARNLATHPEWHIKPDAALVAQVRQLLLRQMGRRNADGALYQKMLQSVANNYADLTLVQMVGDTDAQALFTTQEVVPGMFTRQAWEGQVQKAIETAATARREEIDWVLSDSQHPVSDDVSPEALKARLTERYFSDFSNAWLNFLNSLRLNKAANLSDVTDQLTLMGDVRQSPLIALMNTLAYQGQTGARSEALSDTLVKSAQNLLHKDKQPAIDQGSEGPTGPLDGTFGPLLTLMGKGNTTGVMTADSSLSLQTFLTRLTRVRLKLQQVANANDPQEMTQILAQTVFEGKSVDLTDTQEYGNLIAASLGSEWRNFGQTLFVQPLNQAWQTVLQPSAASLNSQWQASIVTSWRGAFDGRYPFAATRSDASLPMLGQFIRADSGRIDQFLTRQLGGVLHKEGNRWVPDKVNSQGLRFNPAFLQAVNQLSQLADILYTDGGMGIRFELMGKPVRDVVETTFNLDGQKLRYFNQMESWQSFNWPGATDKPGVMLTWTSVNGGANLFADEQGNWGLIRLLEKAAITPLDDGDTRYRLILNTPDGIPLTWNMRTELGRGPLALLKLRGFTLPTQIFDVQAEAVPLPGAETADNLAEE